MFKIKINTSTFYKKLGKYSQIMQLFKIMGFKLNQTNCKTAFKYIKDPNSKEILDLSWKQKYNENDSPLRRI